MMFAGLSGQNRHHPDRRLHRDGRPGWGPAIRPATIRLRQIVNWLNLATPLGLLVATLGRYHLEPGPHGVLVARDYRWPILPVQHRAITIGDVVLLGVSAEGLAQRPFLLHHEARHSGQWARWLGPAGFLPAYVVCCAWSWWFTGDPALRNHFECAAGLIDGGYAS